MNVPTRAAPLFGATRTRTVPLPVPLPPEAISTNDELLNAVHAQPVPVVTVMSTVVPPAGGLRRAPVAQEVVAHVYSRKR